MTYRDKDKKFLLETIADLIKRINRAKHERFNQTRTSNGESR